MGDICVLAAELIDRIIDFLHDDEKALRACCLVCRQWLPCSRFHRFHSIYLYGSGINRERRAQTFLKIAPRIGSYVHSLEAYDYARISSIAIHLINLSQVAVHDIDRVHLINLLSVCPFIKSLKLQYSNLDGFTDKPFGAGADHDVWADRAQVETLVIYAIRSGLADFLQWAKSTQLISRLRTIKCWTHAEHPGTFVDTLFPLMRQIGGNLVHVLIQGLPFEADCTEAFLTALTVLENLETLCVGPDILRLTDSEQRYWLLRTIPIIFRHIRSQKITRVSLNLQFNPSVIKLYPDFEDRFNGVWTEVSRLLLAPQFEKCIACVDIDLISGSMYSNHKAFSHILPWKEGQSSWREFIPAWVVETYLFPVPTQTNLIRGLRAERQRTVSWDNT